MYNWGRVSVADELGGICRSFAMLVPFGRLSTHGLVLERGVKFDKI